MCASRKSRCGRGNADGMAPAKTAPCCSVRYRLGALSLFLLGLLFNSGCSVIEPFVDPLLDDLQRQLQAEAEIAIESAVEEAGATLDEATSSAVDSLQAWIEDQIASIQTEAWPSVLAYFGIQAPDEVGILPFGIQTNVGSDVIRQKFQDAFRQAGGARVMGKAVGRVQLIDGSPVLLQEFDKSAIVIMEDQVGKNAYYMSAPWYEAYQSAGGLDDAGLPTSNPESWGASILEVWAQDSRGRRQEMSLNGTPYALMQPSGSETAFLVPPQFWNVYIAAGGPRVVGYPLSSFPLDEATAIQVASGNDELTEMIRVWQDRPYRIQLFTKGSIWFDRRGSRSEIVSAMPANRLFNEEWALLEVAGVLGERGHAWIDIQDQCLSQTVLHAASAASSQATVDLITMAALLPLEASSALLPASSGKAYLGKLVVQGLIELVGSNNLRDDALWFGVGVLADGFFGKAVGDFLAAPLAPLTTEGLRAAAQALDKDRSTMELKWDAGGIDLSGIAQRATPGQMAVTYDPLTHMITGVIKLDNNCPTFAFQFRSKPTDVIEAEDPVWPLSQPEYFDLTTARPVR